MIYRLLRIFNGRGNILLRPNIEPFKYKNQIGLETLVVYTMNQWVLYFFYLLKEYTLTLNASLGE